MRWPSCLCMQLREVEEVEEVENTMRDTGAAECHRDFKVSVRHRSRYIVQYVFAWRRIELWCCCKWDAWRIWSCTICIVQHRRTLGTQLPVSPTTYTYRTNDDNKPDLDINAAHNCGIVHQLLFPPHIASPCAFTRREGSGGRLGSSTRWIDRRLLYLTHQRRLCIRRTRVSCLILACVV